MLKRFTQALILGISVLLFTTTLKAQITSAGSGNWSNTSTWVGGVVPTSANNVIIAPGHTVAIDNNTAACNNVSFGDATAKLDFNAAAGLLSIYGNFTIASTTHAVFTSWVAGAKIKFTGSTATQTISGLPANAAPPFSFRDIVVDKPVGAIVTTQANGMRLGITNSLEVISGSFELAASDDIEARSLTGTVVGGPFTPTITVQSAGTFRMAGVNSHIRSGANTGDNDTKIGKVTTAGIVSLSSGQANRVNFGDVDVLAGGTFEMRSSGSVAATLNTGLVTVMNGGLVKQSYNNAAGNNWFTNVTTPNKIDVQAGGELELNTDKTDYLPQQVTLNSGSIVRYSTLLAQTLSTHTGLSTYSNLILQATPKTLAQNITVTDTLFMRATVNGAPSLALGAFALNYGATATLQYRGIGTPPPAQTTANTEWPASGNRPANVSIYNSSNVSLNGSKTITGQLNFAGIGMLVFGANNLSVSGVSGYDNTKYCVTDGAGSLTIRNVDVAGAVFPVGINATAYEPFSIQSNTGTIDDFSVRVAQGTPCGVTVGDAVNLLWTVSEATPGGSTSNIKVQWNGTDENPGFLRTNSAIRGCNGTTVTSTSIFNNASGTDPYTRTDAGVSTFSTFGVISQPPSVVDMSATALVTPTNGGCKTATETVTITIKNNSTSSINFNANNVTVTATATGGYSSSLVLSSGNLAAGATQNVTMPATINMAAGGAFTFNASTSVAGDVNTGNDAMTPVTINAGVPPSASISYAGTPFCTSVATPQAVTLTGTTGGTYSASPAGLSINATSGAVTPSTSTGGSYTVTYTIAAANGCPQVQATTPVTITTAPSATISYAGSPYCTNGGTASPTLTGTSGGTYSASPAGLTINSTNGNITLAASIAGTYTVTYSIAAGGGCAAVNTTATVVVNAAQTAGFNYGGTTTFCQTGTNPVASITGTAGGTFSATPAGLVFVSTSTGEINLAASAINTYSITYTTAGPCAASSSLSVSIVASPSANFSYTGSPYCSNGTNPSPTYGPGASAGVFSATPAGLVFVSTSTGQVNLAASTPGTYTVTNFIAASGGCASATASATITITAAPSATISYTSAQFCNSVSAAQPVTVTGTSGGTFSASPAGLSINVSTGAITPSTSSLGTYTITYTVAAGGGCAAYTTTTQVSIVAAPNASISYAGSPYCNSVTTAQPVTFTGTTGGTFSASPAGLSINTSTGAVTPSTSTAGVYTVTYTIAASGGCNAFTTTATITITAAPNATIAYAGSPYCNSVTIAQPVTITGTTGGSFSSTAGLSINATTGAITPSTSTPGTYTVTYTVAASGGCAAITRTTTVTITALPAATISYTGSPYCSSLTTAQPVTRTGTAGGTYSASPAGLSINTTTGAVTPSTSTPGTYTVTYTMAAAGGCSAVAVTTSVTISSAPSATIGYTGGPYCTSGGTATVTRTGSAGGTYSSTAGLSIDANTGAVTLASSTPGTFTVTYTVAAANGCSAFTTTASITVNAVSVAPTSITANRTSSCGPTTVNFTQVGGVLAPGAGWRWYKDACGGTPIGSGNVLNNVAINTTTTIYVRAENGVCGNSACTAVTVTINEVPTVTISVTGDTAITPGQITTLTASATPTTGISYSWFRNGVQVIGVNSSTLVVTSDNLGLYTVTVTTAAGCTATSATVNITGKYSDKLWITPNPNNGRFAVRYFSDRPVSISRKLYIYNGQGSFVYSKDFIITGAYTSMNVDISGMPKGVYFLSVRRSDGKVLVNGKVVTQ